MQACSLLARIVILEREREREREGKRERGEERERGREREGKRERGGRERVVDVLIIIIIISTNGTVEYAVLASSRVICLICLCVLVP